MSELADFKATLTTIISEVKESLFNERKSGKSQQINRQCKKEPSGNFRTKIIHLK